MKLSTQISYGTIKVSAVDKHDSSFKLTLPFFDRAEYDNAIVILDGIKEIRIDPFWGSQVHTARSAVDAVKFWILDRL